MDFYEVLTRRVSTRSYTEQMPDQEMIQKIIDAALLAPIVRWHKLHLTVVTNKEAMRKAEEAANEFFNTKNSKLSMYGAPVWIVLSGEKHRDDNKATEEMRNNNLFWNIGSIIENMELMAASLGLASCSMNATIVAINDKPDVKQAVGIPEGYDALGSVLIGYADQEIPVREVNSNLIPVTYQK